MKPEEMYYAKGKKSGRQTAKKGCSQRIIFTGENNNEHYIKGYKEGYEKSRSLMSLEEVQYAKGKHSGCQAARVKLIQRAEFVGENNNEHYIKGYNEGYEKNRRLMSFEEFQYVKGRSAGSQAAKTGLTKRAKFVGENNNEHYVKGYNEAYEKNRRLMSSEEFQYAKGRSTGYRTAKLGYAKRIKFVGRNNNESYIKGYNDSFDKVIKNFPFIALIAEEKNIFNNSQNLNIPCYQHPHIKDTVLFYFEDKCSPDLANSADIMQKNPGIDEISIHNVRAKLFAENLEKKRKQALEIFPSEELDQTEKIEAKGPFVIIKGFTAVCEVLCFDEDLSKWMLTENSFSAAHYPLPSRTIIDELLKQENKAISVPFSESINFTEINFMESEVDDGCVFSQMDAETILNNLDFSFDVGSLLEIESNSTSQQSQLEKKQPDLISNREDDSDEAKRAWQEALQRKRRKRVSLSTCEFCKLQNEYVFFVTQKDPEQISLLLDGFNKKVSELNLNIQFKTKLIKFKGKNELIITINENDYLVWQEALAQNKSTYSKRKKCTIEKNLPPEKNTPSGFQNAPFLFFKDPSHHEINNQLSSSSNEVFQEAIIEEIDVSSDRSYMHG